MHVALLSDFSSASRHMLDYAAMLFQNQEVRFTILHVKTPCTASKCAGKCDIIFQQKLKKEKSWLQNKGYTEKQIEIKFIEGSYIESMRQFVTEQHVDLILIGSSSQKIFNTGFFFDKKTLEVVTKVKCSVVLVPEDVPLHIPQNALLPTDFSITSDYSTFNILTSLAFVNNTHLSLITTRHNMTLGPNKAHAKDLISRVINSLEFKSVKEVQSTLKAAYLNKYDLVMIMAKNLSIFKELFSTTSDTKFQPEVPFLFLHDSKTI